MERKLTDGQTVVTLSILSNIHGFRVLSVGERSGRTYKACGPWRKTKKTALKDLAVWVTYQLLSPGFTEVN